jgi:hypothetical protein
MLFAILGAIVGMFLEMKLPPARERPYDPAIGEGYIGISVITDSNDRNKRAESIMKETGALRVAGGEKQ